MSKYRPAEPLEGAFGGWYPNNIYEDTTELHKDCKDIYELLGKDERLQKVYDELLKMYNDSVRNHQCLCNNYDSQAFCTARCNTENFNTRLEKCDYTNELSKQNKRNYKVVLSKDCDESQIKEETEKIVCVYFGKNLILRYSECMLCDKEWKKIGKAAMIEIEAYSPKEYSCC